MHLKTSVLIVLSFLTGLYFYPQLPLNMGSHWNIKGEVDGYMSRFWGVFLMPLLSVFMYVLFLILPRIDPLKANIDKFRIHFNRFIFVLMLFMYYIYVLTLVWNLGYRFNLMQLLSPAFAILYYFMGELMTTARPNWFIGIRTPWTLSDPQVWDKTHKLGGKLFKTCSVFALLGIIFPQQEIWWILFPVLTTTLWTFTYSYLEFSKSGH